MAIDAQKPAEIDVANQLASYRNDPRSPLAVVAALVSRACGLAVHRPPDRLSLSV